MKIAILSLSNRPTMPPSTYGYGGMTRVNWWLAEMLSELGHEVSFFGVPGTVAPEDVELIEYPHGMCHSNLKCAGVKKAGDKAMALWFQDTHLDNFDVIHEMSHRLPIALFCEGPILATMQNPNQRKRWGVFARNLVAVSPAHAQMYWQRSGGKRLKKRVPWVFNCAKVGAVPYCEEKDGPFFLMGVMQKYKGVKETIEAAIVAEVPLVLAGTAEKGRYFQQECLPLMKGHKNIEFIGEVQGEKKDWLLSHSLAAMLYVKWREPGTMFGVEAMAAGTPIIGSHHGCIPDYVEHGETGYLCKTVEEMAQAMIDVREDGIASEVCYKRYLEHFTVAHTAKKYLGLYKRTAGGEQW